MPNPFPGINPYLEQPDDWSDLHNQLVAAIARNVGASVVAEIPRRHGQVGVSRFMSALTIALSTLPGIVSVPIAATAPVTSLLVKAEMARGLLAIAVSAWVKSNFTVSPPAVFALYQLQRSLLHWPGELIHPGTPIPGNCPG